MNAARVPFSRSTVPAEYNRTWLGEQLGRIARALWQPTSRRVVADDIIRASDDCLFVDASAAPVTVTLLPPDQVQFAMVTVKKVDTTANVITLGGTVDGVLNMTMPYPMMSLTLQSDGAAWWIK